MSLARLRTGLWGAVLALAVALAGTFYFAVSGHKARRQRNAPGRRSCCVYTIRPQPYWNGDFSTGSFLQYDSFAEHNVDGHMADYALVTDRHPPGISPEGGPFRFAFRATVSSGTGSIVAGQSGERTLTTLWPTDNPRDGKSLGYQGADTWYRDEIYFPSGFQPSRNTDFNWVFELHNAPDDAGDAMLECGIDTSTGPRGPYSDGGGSGSDPSPERFSCRIFGGGSPAHPFEGYDSTNWFQNPAVHWAYLIGLRHVPSATWLDMVWNVRWDWRSLQSGGRGRMRWWINGRLVGTYAGPTLLYVRRGEGGVPTHGGNQAYLQTGYYRPDNRMAGYAQPTTSVYHAATMIGPTARSIGESLR
jgi:hypothetical protein